MQDKDLCVSAWAKSTQATYVRWHEAFSLFYVIFDHAAMGDDVGCG